MAISVGAILAASLISSMISGIVSYVGNSANVQAQKDINQQNVEAQNNINQQNIEYSKEFAQNGISWKMEDLQNAGLNPVLAAGMSGNNPQPTAMSAPQQKAPIMDLSGISSAIMAMNNMMMSSYLMSQRNDISSDRNDVMRERNTVLNNLYKRKAFALESSNQSPMIMSSKQMAAARKKMESEMSKADLDDWNRIMKELGYHKKH